MSKRDHRVPKELNTFNFRWVEKSSKDIQNNNENDNPIIFQKIIFF